MKNPWRYCLTAAGSSALLLWLSYFPADLGFLGWVALAPLLLLVRAPAPPRVVYLSAWAGGLAFFVPALAWMRVADDTMVAAWLALSLYCSWYFPAAVWLLRRIDGRTGLPLALTTPVVYVALEHLRSWLISGFPWYFLGHTQHAWIGLIQVSDLAGAYAVSVLVAAVNGWVVDLKTYGFVAARRNGAAIAALIVAALAYGEWQLRTAQFTEGPTVALVQTNISQDERTSAWQSKEADERATTNIRQQMLELMDRAAANRPDLIVLPETTFPWKLTLSAPGLTDADLDWRERETVAIDRDALAQAARRVKTPVLIGASVGVVGRPSDEMLNYNSAFLVRADGTVVDRYDKIHRVPFGEFVPLETWMPWLQKLTPYEGYKYGIEAGTTATRFPVTSGGLHYRFGVLICYEDSDAVITRRYAGDSSEPVDFFVNISNDGWFRGSAEHEQHLAISRFRAVECRRTVVRAVNVGISAVIDGNGRVVALPAATWAQSKGVAGVVTAAVPIDGRGSLYAVAGDWLPVLCWVLVAGGCFAPRRQGVRLWAQRLSGGVGGVRPAVSSPPTSRSSR